MKRYLVGLVLLAGLFSGQQAIAVQTDFQPTRALHARYQDWGFHLWNNSGQTGPGPYSAGAGVRIYPPWDPAAYPESDWDRDISRSYVAFDSGPTHPTYLLGDNVYVVGTNLALQVRAASSPWSPFQDSLFPSVGGLIATPSMRVGRTYENGYTAKFFVIDVSGQPYPQNGYAFKIATEAYPGQEGGVGFFNLTASTLPLKDILLQNSVHATVSGSEISATFEPRYGYTLAETAAVLGVHHFNWLQRVYVPNRWTVEDTAIVGLPLPQPVIDPNPNAVFSDYRVYPYSDPTIGATISLDSPFRDNLPYYWGEPTGQLANETDTFELTFFDEPMVDSTWLLPGEKLRFETALVGVKADGSYLEFPDLGTSFSWTSNSAFDGTGSANLTGYFSTLDNGQLPPVISGGIGGLTFDIPGTPFPGDANGDRVVDFTDLGILLNNYNQTGTFASGDFNSSGTADFTDLGILLNNYNQTAPAFSPAAAVPEPSTLLLAAIGLCGLALGSIRALRTKQ